MVSESTKEHFAPPRLFTLPYILIGAAVVGLADGVNMVNGQRHIVTKKSVETSYMEKGAQELCVNFRFVEIFDVDNVYPSTGFFENASWVSVYIRFPKRRKPSEFSFSYESIGRPFIYTSL